MSTSDPAQPWERLKQYGYAPGYYMSMCHKCQQVVCNMDKRAITCRACAEALSAASQPTAATVSRCATCTHWDPVKEDDLFNEIRGSGNCLKIRHIDEVATKRDHGDDEWTGELVLQPQHAGVLAVAVDGSGYRARVVTMPDFGCVLHSPKEAP